MIIHRSRIWMPVPVDRNCQKRILQKNAEKLIIITYVMFFAGGIMYNWNIKNLGVTQRTKQQKITSGVLSAEYLKIAGTNLSFPGSKYTAAILPHNTKNINNIIAVFKPEYFLIESSEAGWIRIPAHLAGPPRLSYEQRHSWPRRDQSARQWDKAAQTRRRRAQDRMGHHKSTAYPRRRHDFAVKPLVPDVSDLRQQHGTHTAGRQLCDLNPTDRLPAGWYNCIQILQ